jgi:aspartyl-tRNA(Asn)/glutamyl-tRNA(Gln) amidotransferase subunit A
VLSTILGAEQASIFEPLISSGKVDELADPSQIAGLKASLEIPAKDYLKAMRIRRLLQNAIQSMWGGLDAVVSPARTGIAPKADQPLSPPPSAASSATRGPTPPAAPSGLGAITPAGNLAGLPALILPCGFADNMPIAIQLVGPPWSENTLLAIGEEFQTRTDWHKRKPAGV